MDFDFEGWNARIDKIQSVKPGTFQFTERVRKEMDESRRKVDLPLFDGSDEENKKKDSNACIIATACVSARGLEADCEELNTLRIFRDQYVRLTPSGPGDILDYYEVAPIIVKSIDSEDESRQVYDVLYERMVLPVLGLIDEDRLDDAHFQCGLFLKNLKQTFL